MFWPSRHWPINTSATSRNAVSLKANLINLSRHSFIYTFSTFIQRTLGLIMLPIYTDVSYLASSSDYGDYTLVYTFIAFMNIIYLYGMDAAFMRYYFLGRFSRENIYKTAFLFVGGNALLMSLIIFLAAEPLSVVIFGSDQYIFFVQMAAVILTFDTFCNLPYLILRAEERSVAYTGIRVSRFVVELALNIVFVVVLKQGVKGIIYANALSALVNLIVLIPAQKPYLKGQFEKPALREMLLFALPMIPNGIAYLVVEVSDKFLMRILLDKETLGVYSANYRFGTILLMLVMAFRTAWQPFFLKIAKQEDARRIYARVLTYFTLMATLITIVVTFFIGDLVRFPLPGNRTLMGENYWGGIGIIPVILVSYMLYGFYVNFTVGIYITKKTRWMILFTGLAALVNVSSNFYLMPAFGMMGAAVATLLSYLVMTVTIYIANQKLYHVPYEYRRITLLLIVLSVALGLYYGIDLLLWHKLLFLAIVPLLLFLGGFLDRGEWLQLKRLAGKLK